MNELDEKHRSNFMQRPTDPARKGRAGVLKAIVIVLAVIGVIALIAVAGMFWMHESMMGGMSMGMGMGRR